MAQNRQPQQQPQQQNPQAEAERKQQIQADLEQSAEGIFEHLHARERWKNLIIAKNKPGAGREYKVPPELVNPQVSFEEKDGPAHFSKAADDFKASLANLEKLDVFKPAAAPGAVANPLEADIKTFKEKKLEEKFKDKALEIFNQMKSGEPLTDAKGAPITDSKAYAARLQQLAEEKLTTLKTDFKTELNTLRAAVERQVVPQMRTLKAEIGEDAKPGGMMGMGAAEATGLKKSVADAEAKAQAAVRDNAPDVVQKQNELTVLKADLEEKTKKLNDLQGQLQYIEQVGANEVKRIESVSGEKFAAEMKRINQALDNDQLTAYSYYQRAVNPDFGSKLALHKRGEKDVDETQLLMSARGLNKLPDGTYHAKDESYVKDGDGWRPVLSEWEKVSPSRAEYAQKYENLLNRLVRDGGAKAVKLFYKNPKFAKKADVQAIFEILEKRMLDPNNNRPLVPFNVDDAVWDALKVASKGALSGHEDPGSADDPNSLIGRIKIYNARVEKNEWEIVGGVKVKQLEAISTNYEAKATARNAVLNQNDDYKREFKLLDTAKNELLEAEKKLAKATDAEKPEAKRVRDEKKSDEKKAEDKLDTRIKNLYLTEKLPDTKSPAERITIATNEIKELRTRANELAVQATLIQQTIISLNGDMKQQPNDPTLVATANALKDTYYTVLAESKDTLVKLQALDNDVKTNARYQEPPAAAAAAAAQVPQALLDAKANAASALESITKTHNIVKNEGLESQVVGMPDAIQVAKNRAEAADIGAGVARPAAGGGGGPR